MTDSRAAADPFLAAQPIVLRQVRPPETPWPAALVRHGEGLALLVDAALLPAGSHGPPGEHVVRAIEVFRTGDGHAVLLPHVVRRVTPAVAADRGAAVTLAVSLLRGVAESAADTPGQWWLAEDGRPLFVPVATGDPAAAAAAALLREAADPGGPDLLAELADALPEIEPRDLAGWEERLFALHAPTAMTVGSEGSSPPVARRRERPRTARREAASPVLRAVVDIGVAAMVSDAGSAVWRVVRRLRERRRPLVVATAAVAAVVVVAVGLSWPGGTEAPAEAEPVATAAPPVTGSADGDPVAATGELLETLRGCGDAACRAGVMEDPATPLPAGAATAGAPALSLVDDLGGLAVVRAVDESGAAASQIVLVVSRDGRWLVRDVYDAADQP